MGALTALVRMVTRVRDGSSSKQRPPTHLVALPHAPTCHGFIVMASFERMLP